jgi:hypothetical protein
MKGVAGLLFGVLVTFAMGADARTWDDDGRGNNGGKSWGYGNNGGYRDDGGDGASILCESIKGRRQRCSIDTRYGVWLQVQHSRSDCIEGVSWGYDRRGVWVSDGCRAEFAVGRPRDRYRDDRGVPSGWQGGGWQGQGHGQRIMCESINERYQQCLVRGVRDVQLARVLSRSRCDYGHSWGFDRNGIWVDRGCRAEFTVR